MDKYEYKVSSDEIKQLIAQGEYAQAAQIADSIDWRRVKSVMMLCTVSDLYKINRRYEDARDMLLLAYERRPGGRTICYSLCELSIKMEEYVQAIEYYKEFVQVAPKDPGRYILQYKLYEAQDVSLEERIEVLEELKKRDYREKWAYELAYLYHRVGLATRCVEECDELILWFGSGKYVVKAMELKMLHQPLSPEQQECYDHRFDNVYEEQMDAQPEEATVEQAIEQEQELITEEPVTGEETFVDGDTKIFEVVRPEMLNQPKPEAVEDMDIHVKTVDVGEYNTINLQAELAEGLKEVLAQEVPVPKAEEKEENWEEEVETDVFFGETAEITDIQGSEELPVEETTVEDVTAEIVMEQMRLDTVDSKEDQILVAQPPKELAGVLSQESDGQIRLVMPESDNLEKQITGQMSIEDILAEWERMKKENEEKRKEDVRQHVLEQTGTMFTEFEESMRDGLLEQLESGRINLDEAIDEVEAELVESEMTYAEAEDVVQEESESDPAEDILEETDIVEDEVEELEEIVDVTEDVEIELADEETEPEFTEEEIEEEVEFTEDEVEEPEEIVEAMEEDEATEPEEIDEVTEEPEAEPVEEETEEVEEVSEPKIEREPAKLRALTREEKELYAPYIQSRTSKEQLINAVDNISMAAYTGNIIITGVEGTDTLGLAKNMIREVQLTDSNFSGKVAKISGKALNDKDVESTIEAFNNGALIIEKVSDLKDSTVQTLYKCLQQESLGIIVVLEDTKKSMEQFLAKHEKLKEVFTSRVDMEVLSNDALVAYGKQYAKQMEYAIDDLGVLALHTRIEELQTIDHAVTTLEVKEIVDEAIDCVNRKSIGHFLDVLFAKRYDEEDMIILTEKDFV